MVTVIVPVFNLKKTLKKCVDSVLSQTYSDLEIILVSEWASIPVMGMLKRDRTGDDTMMRVI